MTGAIVVVAALVLVPGVGAALALAAPGGISLETRLALCFGLGYAVVAGVATLLALAHALSAPTFGVALALATVAVWTLALRRARPRVHGAELRAQAAEAPFALASGLVVLVAVAVSRPFYPPGVNLSIAAPWRYWADGLEIAAAGHVPGETAQWGTEIPTTVSKIVLNSFEGGVSFVLGPDPLPAMQAVLALAVVGFVAALLALGRELGLGVFAPLVPALAVFLPGRLPLSAELADDLTTYKVENVGRMVALCAVLVGMHAIRARAALPLAVVSGVLLAVAGLTHLVPALVAGAVLAVYVPAAVLTNRWSVRRALGRGAAIAATFAVCYAGVLGLAGGDLGFDRATAGTAFEAFPPGVDPTRSFQVGRLVRARPARGDFLVPPGTIVRRYQQETVGEQETLGARRSGRLGGLALAVLALVTVVMVLVERRFIPVAAVAWGLVGTFVAVALLFSYRYRTWIPANFGFRRLFDYAALPPALLVPGALEAIASPLARRSRPAVAALALAAGLLAVAAALDRIPRDRSLPQAAAGIGVIERVADAVPCGTRMLVNARTAGSWEAMTGRRTVTEGMAPYLRAQIMERVLPVLFGARGFFRNPQANRAFLVRERVEYVVVVEPGAWIGAPGGAVFPRSDAETIASLPDVHPVLRDPDVAVFAVGSSAAARAGGQPPRCPL